MAAKQPVWGIDLGQCSLKAVQLQAAGEGVELIGFDLVEHEQILSQSEGNAAELSRKAIETFISRNDLSKSRVVVSVPSHQTLMKFPKMPPVDAKKIPDMVQYEAGQQIPFDLDEVVWDYQVFMDGDAPEREVGIFAIRKELIHNYLSMFTSQGVEPMMVQTSPMATYNAARFELNVPEGETYVLLDISALSADFIVLDSKNIWARSVPNVGGNRFTEALVTAFKIPFKKAEKLKRTAASSKYARQIFQAMRPVFAELVTEVQRSIGFYTSTHRDSHITKIVGMGNAFGLPGLQKFLQQSVQMKVEKFPGYGKLVEVSNPKKAEFDENAMSLAVAYGLGVQGLGLAAVNSNLLPPELRKALLWQKKKPWFVASAACLALAAGSIFVGNSMAQGDIDRALSNVGGVDNLRARSYSDVQAAESAIKSAGSIESPLEKGMAVLGAAKFLKSEYSKYTSGSKDVQTLNTLAKFPENNRFVPQILDVIHRAFDESMSPDLKSIKSNQDYLSRIKDRIPRAQRKEVFVDQLNMEFLDDPGSRFAGEGEGTARRGGPGWAIEVRGITTEQNPAPWLEATLSKALLEVGREPKKGIYFDTISIARVQPRSKSSSSSDFGEGIRGGSSSSDTGGGRNVAAGGGRGGRGGRPGGGRLPMVEGGGGRRVPGGAGDYPGGPGSKVEGSADVKGLALKFEGKDPLTGEEITGDFEFTLQIVVRKADTPANEIPDRYKDKPAETAGADANKKG